MDLGGYSAFEHLVSALLLKPETLMVIIAPDPLTLYCDASGKEHESLIVVAGAVSSVERWRRFDKEWKQALADNSLKYFRMSEFAHSIGQFKKGWKGHESRRQEFLKRLVRIAIKHLQCWIGAAIWKSEYDKADHVYQAREFLSAYPFCGITCIELAVAWARAQKLDYLPMEFVFEAGDDGWGQLEKRVREDYKQSPIPCAKEQATPLQFADFAAYEIRRAYLTAKNDELIRFRSTLGLLTLNIPHKWGEQNETGIRMLMKMRGVHTRAPKP